MIQRYAQFWFLEKGLGIVSPPHFVKDFSRKMFLKLYSLNWPDFTLWLSLLLEILNNICIAISVLLWIKLTFIIKPFFYMTKKPRQKLNILRTKRAFKMKQFFIIFKELPATKNCLRSESAPLKIIKHSQIKTLRNIRTFRKSRIYTCHRQYIYHF